MLWDVFYAHGVGHTDADRVESACLQQCAGPLIQDVSQSRDLEYILDL